MSPKTNVTSDLGPVIAGLYEAALDRTLWPAVLADAARRFNASRAMVATPLRSPLDGGFEVVHNISPTDLEHYDAHFRTRNLWTHGHFKRQAGREGAFTGDMFVSYDELANSEFYADYLKRQDAYHLCTSAIHRRAPAADLVSITMTRGRRQRKFSEEHRRAIGALAPHVQRALAIHDRIAGGDGAKSIDSDALQLATSAVFLVNGSAKVLRLSPAAERIVRDGSILKVHCDHLASVQDNDRLAEAIREVSMARTGGRFSRILRLGDGTTPGVRAHLLVATADTLAAEGVLVVLGPLAATRDVRLLDSLQSIYRLTPAESRLCELLKEGHSLKEAAGRLSIRASTAGSQLKSVFLKTGIGRQADLVRTLLDIAALAGASESVFDGAG